MTDRLMRLLLVRVTLTFCVTHDEVQKLVKTQSRRRSAHLSNWARASLTVSVSGKLAAQLH